MKLVLVLPFLAFSITSVSAQQAAPTPPVTTGIIVGRAVDGVGGKPLAGVTVSLGAGAPGLGGAASVGGVTVPLPPGNATRVMTDSEGHFVFRGLAKGSFSITATKPGYLGGAHGKRTPAGGGHPLDLAEGDRGMAAAVDDGLYITGV